MKLLIACSCMAFTGCSSLQMEPATPEGAFLASIKMTEGAFSGRPKADTGYFFFIQDLPGVAGPLLKGYRYENGRIRDTFGGHSDSTTVVQAIRDVGLEPFDFVQEVKAVASRLSNEAEVRGETYLRGFVLDGKEFEISVQTAKGIFTLREWNPGYSIDQFAPHSEKIAKLKAVLDMLEQYYGRSKFGI